MSHNDLHQNFIGGKWMPSVSQASFENRNPANTDDVIGHFPDSQIEDINQAVAAATTAFHQWRLVPAPKRAELIFRAAERLTDRKADYARAMTREMGKVLTEAAGDVQEAIDMSYYMAGEGRRQFGQTTPAELPNKFAMSVRQPLGVCGLISPWNFPMAIPSWKIMPALVCGNTVVLKPAPETPLSAAHLVKILEDVGVPPGVVNMVHGGADIGAALTRHSGVQVISFTGSNTTGRLVAQACAPDFRRCHLEMGGKNAIIVMDDANLELAIDGAVWGGFGTSGQRCTAASRVIVHQKVYKAFLEGFTERTRRLRVGDGQDPSVQVGPLVRLSQMEKVLSYIRIGMDEGAKRLIGGRRLESGAYAKGFFVEPTIFGDVDPNMRIAQEEIFGPVSAVIPCDDLAQAIAIANRVSYGLSAAIYTQDINKAFTAMRDLHTGIFYVNASTIGAEVHLPFGGVKATGNGHREAGQAALDFFSEWKSIYVDFSGKLQRAQIDRE
ncbi:MAG: aldehyde dehydrogenase family protein [Acidobacteria bacterium]|nr:aldehyde dehydrogenase family protein [Acidobacteriota bacterium]MBI3656990.1 aldehyde dehydrogenase family protein [Acidobacteriota bacterium]